MSSPFTTVVLAFDPGIHGAYALVDDDGLAAVFDLPVLKVGATKTTARADLDPATLTMSLNQLRHRVDHCFIERVAARPGQGVTSMFRFGYAAGTIHGVVAALGIPYTFVTPQTWQRALRVPSSDDAARQRAQQLYPGQAANLANKAHAHRADALLIAHHGLNTLRQGAGAGDKAVSA